MESTFWLCCDVYSSFKRLSSDADHMQLSAATMKNLEILCNQVSQTEENMGDLNNLHKQSYCLHLVLTSVLGDLMITCAQPLNIAIYITCLK